MAARQRATLRWPRRRDRRAPRSRLGASGGARPRTHDPAVRSGGPGPATRPHSARGLMEAIEHPPIFRLPAIFSDGYIPDHVTYTWLVMIILTGIAFVASRRMELVPRGAQNLMEIVLEQFQGMIDDVMGPQGRPYLPFIATLGLFIFAANLMSLVPGFTGPTTNLNTTAACAVIVFVAYHAIGLRAQGPVNYIKHFMGPV